MGQKDDGTVGDMVLPAGVCGVEGTRWDILSSRGDDVGEGDHVVLRVSTSLLLADRAAGLWRPLLHTHTHKLFILRQSISQCSSEG